MSVQEAPTKAPPGFSIRVRPDRERVIVALAGELDLATVDRVERWVRELCERGFRSIALDLRELSFIDSTGVRLLLRLHELATAEGWRFAIIDGEGPVRRLLQLLRLDERFAHARAER